MKKTELVKICLQFTYIIDFRIIYSHFFYFCKLTDRIIIVIIKKKTKQHIAQVVMTSGIALNSDENLQLYFFNVRRQLKKKKKQKKQKKKKKKKQPRKMSKAE